jgi:trehalose/maltose transport system permease protein
MGVVAAERAQPKARTARRRRVPFKASWLLWVGVVLIMLFCLFPFYWLINTSLKTGADLSSAKVIPPHPNLDNYQSIFRNADFVKALRNSAIISGVTTLIALTIGSFAAYALARLRFPMKFLLLAVVLSITTFPPIAIAAPVFKLWTDLGLYNTYLGLILPDLTFTLPLTIYILTSFFREIPRELEEAALVDGATYFQSFRKVVLPLAAPGLRRRDGAADHPRPALPEAHRRRPHRRRGQGLDGSVRPRRAAARASRTSASGRSRGRRSAASRRRARARLPGPRGHRWPRPGARRWSRPRR